MNVYSLLKKRMSRLSEVKELILKKQYTQLYEQYSDVIAYLLFIEDKEDFLDFIDEQDEISEESFLLAFAYKNKICCSFGLYEENIGLILKQYFRDSEISIECDDLSENILVNLLKKINSKDDCSKKYMLLLDDNYCEGCFYIFCVSNSEYIEEWESKEIRRLV